MCSQWTSLLSEPPLTSTRRLSRASRATSPWRSARSSARQAGSSTTPGLPSAHQDPRGLRKGRSGDRAGRVPPYPQRARRGRANDASYRFAMVVGEDNKPRLQMQSLPASSVLLWKSSSERVTKFSSVTIRNKNFNTTCADVIFLKLRNETGFRFAW